MAVRILASSLTPFSLAGSPARRGLLLELRDEEGRVGQGEATPYPGFSLDDVASCARALEHARARVRHIPVDEPIVPAVAAAVAQAIEPLAPTSIPAARFALETAILDLIGQRKGASIASLLRGAAPLASVAVNGLLVASPDAEALLRAARAILARGLSTLKIKLRSTDEASFARDLAALKILRSELPPSIELRFDANAAFTIDTAKRRLDALAPLAPSFVEQPVAPRDLPRLGRCAVPWAADESLLYEDLVPSLLDADGCSAFILKPSAIGLLRALNLAARAGERGLGVVVTHFFDGPVAFAAACELALGLPHPPLACGLDPHPAISDWIGSLPQAARGGAVVPSNAPGLALRFDPASSSESP